MRRLLLFIFLILTAGILMATHNRAGEITYVQVGDLTIRVTVTTYTKTSSSSVDRDSIEVFWGDGSSEFIQRTLELELPGDVKRNEYVTEHTYPGRDTYTIGFADPNRVANILNVNPPNSVDVPFYLETQFTFLNSQFQGYNSSAVLLQPPLDFACSGRRFVHNPNAFDIDGDSLSYELIVPLQDVDTPVPGYFFPDQLGTGSVFEIDPVTGTLVWDAPEITGLYNIAFSINEYREGVLINSIIRDMQINVIACNDSPPAINIIEEICVVAGEKLEIPVEVTDPDEGDMAILGATGGPFEIPGNLASLLTSDSLENTPFTGIFEWQTTCDDISDSYYQVVFRAVDAFGLADLKALRIKVVGPPPENLSSMTIDQTIRLEWDSPYRCEVTDDYFVGFSIWKKIGSTQFELDTCDPGLDGRGYQRIGFVSESTGDNYNFFDAEVDGGTNYCYRVLAEFAKLSPNGIRFNRVESLPSNEICQILSRDIPFITKVSVLETDLNQGMIQVDWVKPLAEDLDTIANPGPYRYQLLRSIDMGANYVPIPLADFTTLNFSDPVTTSFIDQALNTELVQYYYQIAFYTNGNADPYDFSAEASSVFLNIGPTDKKNVLQWDYFTPWNNFKFDIYRLNNVTGVFDSIGSSTVPMYDDENLMNDSTYCYFVRTTGSYGINNITDPILNNSQEKCATPFDNVPPCAPELAIQSPCDVTDISVLDPENFINRLSWSNDPDCLLSSDIAGYNIYYAETEGESMSIIATIDQATTTILDHKPSNGILGCYVITAFDSNGNESDDSNRICVDNCPLYQLPNTFTPNNDGANDVFKPTVNKFINSVDFQVFNRWGNKVFETSDPQLNWNGSLFGNGKELSDGTYYYTCKVFEERVDGISENPELLSGYIHLIRG